MAKAVIKTSKGKVLPEYPKLVKNPKTNKKVLVNSEEEEAKLVATFPKQAKDGSWA